MSVWIAPASDADDLPQLGGPLPLGLRAWTCVWQAVGGLTGFDRDPVAALALSQLPGPAHLWLPAAAAFEPLDGGTPHAIAARRVVGRWALTLLGPGADLLDEITADVAAHLKAEKVHALRARMGRAEAPPPKTLWAPLADPAGAFPPDLAARLVARAVAALLWRHGGEWGLCFTWLARAAPGTGPLATWPAPQEHVAGARDLPAW